MTQDEKNRKVDEYTRALKVSLKMMFHCSRKVSEYKCALSDLEHDSFREIIKPPNFTPDQIIGGGTL